MEPVPFYGMAFQAYCSHKNARETTHLRDRTNAHPNSCIIMNSSQIRSENSFCQTFSLMHSAPHVPRIIWCGMPFAFNYLLACFDFYVKISFLSGIPQPRCTIQLHCSLFTAFIHTSIANNKLIESQRYTNWNCYRYFIDCFIR